MTATTFQRLEARLGEYRWPVGIGCVAVLAWILRNPLSWLGARIAFVFGGAIHDAVLNSTLRRFPGFYYMGLDWSNFAGLFATHLRLTVESLAFAILFALPIGILIQRFRVLYLPAFTLLDAVYVIPSIAVFPVLVASFGVTQSIVIFVVGAYAQFILVRNVFAGFDGVPSEVKEAARGMGMNKFQILTRIEFPLALPVIVAGFRIATVAAIGIVSIGALTGFADLGSYFFSASASGGVNATGQIEAGVVGVVALALGADIILRIFERLIPANRIQRGNVARADRSAFRNRVAIRLGWSRPALRTLEQIDARAAEAERRPASSP